MFNLVRIKCNLCNETKNIKPDTYDNMLRRFGFARSFIFGVTHGLEAVVKNKAIQSTINREETEKSFYKTYVCQECKNNRKDTIKVTQSLNRILNLPKSQSKKQNNNPQDNDQNES